MSKRSTVEVDGLVIRRMRKLAGLDMRDLATTAGISTNYLSRIETGTRRNIRASAYGAIRTALGATDQQLLADTEDY